MRRIFADENRIQKYLDIEAALARAQARFGIIPQDACDEILRHCSIAEYDFAKLKTQTERIGYPVLPVVQQLVALCRDGLGEWCHWGATTQDITDTATVLQSARRSISSRRTSWPSRMRLRASRNATATPRWRAAAISSRRSRSPSGTRSRPPGRLRAPPAAPELRPRVLVGEFGGAAGTLSSLGNRGLEVQAALMRELRLGSRPSPGTRYATASPRSAASSASSPAPAPKSPLM